MRPSPNANNAAYHVRMAMARGLVVRIGTTDRPPVEGRVRRTWIDADRAKLVDPRRLRDSSLVAEVLTVHGELIEVAIQDLVRMKTVTA